eukprot:755737-Pelagomonas_calceolata.AAC.2
MRRGKHSVQQYAMHMRAAASRATALPEAGRSRRCQNLCMQQVHSMRRARKGRLPDGKKRAGANHLRMGRREAPFVPLLLRGQPRTAWIRGGGMSHGMYTLGWELKEPVAHCPRNTLPDRIAHWLSLMQRFTLLAMLVQRSDMDLLVLAAAVVKMQHCLLLSQFGAAQCLHGQQWAHVAVAAAAAAAAGGDGAGAGWAGGHLLKTI